MSGTQRTHVLRSRPSLWTLPVELGPLAEEPRFPRALVPVTLIPPNGFISKRHRDAALRERGLLPPRIELSGQEREANEHIACVPSPPDVVFDGTAEAGRFKADWLAVDRTSEGSDAGCGTPISHSLSTELSSTLVPTLGAGVIRRSSKGTDPFSEPLQQVLVTPPPLPSTVLPIITSNPPVSPSSSQSSHPPFPETSDVRFSTPHRHSASDSGDRPPMAICLSRLWTGFLACFRRLVAGDLRSPSTSTLTAGDHPSASTAQARTAVNPTMHSVETILKETGKIKDAESRRLTERAYLD